AAWPAGGRNARCLCRRKAARIVPGVQSGNRVAQVRELASRPHSQVTERPDCPVLRACQPFVLPLLFLGAVPVISGWREVRRELLLLLLQTDRVSHLVRRWSEAPEVA